MPGDRRWFIPATLVAAFAVAIWPGSVVMYDLPTHDAIIVQRITGRVELTGQALAPVPLKPHWTPLGYLLEEMHAMRTPAADTAVAAVPRHRLRVTLAAPSRRSPAR